MMQKENNAFQLQCLSIFSACLGTLSIGLIMFALSGSIIASVTLSTLCFFSMYRNNIRWADPVGHNTVRLTID